MQMKHTYKLIEAIISKEARVQNKEKGEINRSLILESFSRVFLFLCFPDELHESRHKVSLQFIRKLTMKRIIFPNSTYHRKKYCMLLTVIFLVIWPKFVVALILLAGCTKWWTRAQISTDCFVVGLPNEF